MPSSLYLPTSRSRPEIIPRVRELEKRAPPGLPMASTHSPTDSSSASPNSAGTKLWSLVFNTAKSVVLSTPTTTASYSRPSKVVTVTWAEREFSTTWELVIIYPSLVAIIPVPVLSPVLAPSWVSFAETVTVEVTTRLYTPSASMVEPEGLGLMAMPSVLGVTSTSGWLSSSSGGATPKSGSSSSQGSEPSSSSGTS